MKLIYAYHSKEDVFAILSHNLSDADAEQQLQEMRRAKIPAYALEQPRTHKTMDTDHCGSCVRRVLKALEMKTISSSKKIARTDANLAQTIRRRERPKRRT